MSQNELNGLHIHVRGIVQGVGFRPFIYQAAVKNQLSGWVCNSSGGVEIEVVGNNKELISFLNEIKLCPPPLSRIDEIVTNEISSNIYTQFEIIESISDPRDFIPISPDISICPDCLHELFDPENRRYRYPFINCTNCGPRFSIIMNIPYDRPYTTMAGFELCPNCRSEYQDPLDRRFHAQPIACPTCGPSVEYTDRDGNVLAINDEAIQQAREGIQQGKILAIKGLGGYHLACDAANNESVGLLRERKRRVGKPFALMANSCEVISQFCKLSNEERDLLESRQRPIVLLEKKADCRLPVGLAPGQTSLGFMLPYTPIHYLLLEERSNFPEVLVMTSGNLSEEPIAFEDHNAYKSLYTLADFFLTNNRDIHMRVDDSVMRVIEKAPVFSRRSRGYAPEPLHLPFCVEQILAAGAELKNHFTLTRNNYAFLSHYIGDLENYETIHSYEQTVTHFQNLFRVEPEIIACDLHPDYFSSRYALNKSREDSIPLVQVQHHHAHLAACLAENGWDSDEPVIGLCFDGTGYGTDGTIWGGEILIGGYAGFERRINLDTFPLPGGDKAAKDPARTALSLLSSCNIEHELDLPPFQFFESRELQIVESQILYNINSPITSSMGRLFDGVASLIGIRHHITYEGQAAIELETLANPDEKRSYKFDIHDNVIDFRPVVQSVVKDLRANVPKESISARFHNGIVNLCLDVCMISKQETGISTVAISGGVWQNVFLLKGVNRLLSQNGFTLFFHQKVPTNDACISLGQAVIAARRKK